MKLIINSNPQVNSSDLTIGQTIKIPGYQVSSYKVQANDTFWKIATERRMALDSLTLLNTAINPRQLQIGQTIRIPVTVTYRVLLALTNKERNRGLDVSPFYDQVTISIVPMVDPVLVNLVLIGPPEGEFGEEALRINQGSTYFSGWIGKHTWSGFKQSMSC